jgi:hypothetical protein
MVSSPGKDFGQHLKGQVGKHAQLQEGGHGSGVDKDVDFKSGQHLAGQFG